MKWINGDAVKRVAACFAVWVLAAFSVHAAELSPAPGNTREAYRELTVNFLDLAMNRHQVPEAANRYLTETYIQHNPNVADGRQAFIDAFTVFLKKYPERSWTPKRIFVDGDYVIVHGLYKNSGEERGTAAVDIFRIKDGKIAEHWDVLQPVPEKAANPHPMF
jgi:predicted SnoaL-like aldol condensation-catalyzing enzyme